MVEGCVVTLREELPGPSEYRRLFETTGWNEAYGADEEELFSAISNSWFKLAAYTGGDELIGFGRIVSAGTLYAFVCDLIIAPEHQRRGIGSMILERMIERCREAGIRVVWLFSATDKSAFYENHGFEKRPASAPGMHLKLNIRE